MRSKVQGSTRSKGLGITAFEFNVTPMATDAANRAAAALFVQFEFVAMPRADMFFQNLIQRFELDDAGRRDQRADQDNVGHLRRAEFRGNLIRGKREHARMSVRSETVEINEALLSSTPPGCTSGSYRSNDGGLSTIAALGRRTSGEPISSSETITVQFAVPPRISGP